MRTRRPAATPSIPPLESFDEARLEAFSRELDALLRPLARRWGLNYTRHGLACYKGGIGISPFFPFPKKVKPL